MSFRPPRRPGRPAPGRRRHHESLRRLRRARRKQPTDLVLAEPRSEWGPTLELSDHVRFQAKHGYRAAALPLRPGVWVVTEVPDEGEYGALPLLLTPLLVSAVQQYVQKGGGLPALKLHRDHQEPEPTVGCQGTCRCGRLA
ncbi:MAG: hypothetical protein EP330_08580 [Deltaproteobacteria bacterium]|nr:MAG: hypothetical protein EP330_08580 [Deltaproteobacteria bacterium]